jgi:tetratricopeptide (TPR) repeat protein
MALLLLLGLVILVFFAISGDPWTAWGGILLLLSLAQFSNYLIPLPGIVGERFMYIGSLGFILIFVRLVSFAIEKWDLAESTNLKRLGAALILFLVAGTATYAVQRNRNWKDALTLFRHDIVHLSQSAKAHQLLASELLTKAAETTAINQQNRLLEEAATHFQACVDIYPDFPYAYFDLGTTQMKLGRYEEAQLATEKSVEVDVYNSQAKFQLGIIHELKEEWMMAIEDYQAAIEYDINMIEGYMNLSTLFFRIGNFEEGLNVSYAALEKWPNSADLLINTGNAHAGNNAYTEAAIYFVRALQQSPENRELIQKIIYCLQQTGRADLAEPYLRMLQ